MADLNKAVFHLAQPSDPQEGMLPCTILDADRKSPIMVLHGPSLILFVLCRVHGKNRLGGNSLLECIVFGRIAGKGAVQSFVSPRL